MFFIFIVLWNSTVSYACRPNFRSRRCKLFSSDSRFACCLARTTYFRRPTLEDVRFHAWRLRFTRLCEVCFFFVWPSWFFIHQSRVNRQKARGCLPSKVFFLQIFACYSCSDDYTVTAYSRASGSSSFDIRLYIYTHICNLLCLSHGYRRDTRTTSSTPFLFIRRKETVFLQKV